MARAGTHGGGFEGLRHSKSTVFAGGVLDTWRLCIH